MFTGIVQGIGSVVSKTTSGQALKLAIDMSSLAPVNTSLGDSVAVNGVCLTVAGKESRTGHFDVSAETREKCLVDEWAEGIRVNLETALTLETPIGGHLVSGHVDGIAQVVKIYPDRDYSILRFSAGDALSRFLARKGSIAVDGVSLTINDVTDKAEATEFEVMLVPHTLSHTTLGGLKTDDRVHLEIDQVARYVDRMLSCDRNE